MQIKALVTGGTGFVGQWMRQQESKNLSNLYSVTYLSHKEYDSKEWIKEKWNFIIHLANIDPKEVLECAIKNKTRVLYCSSGAVYKDTLSFYGNNKTDWEVDTIASGVDCSIARLFTFCGAYLKGKNYAVLNFIKNVVDGNPIKIINEKTTRSYMYGSDLGDWMWTILLKGQNLVSYDVGSSHKVTMLDLAKEISKNFSPHTLIDSSSYFKLDEFSSYVPSHSSITEKELGIRIEVPFEEAIRLSIKDYKEGKN